MNRYIFRWSVAGYLDGDTETETETETKIATDSLTGRLRDKDL